MCVVNVCASLVYSSECTLNSQHGFDEFLKLNCVLSLLGAVRDVTGSYHMTYHLLSVMLMIGSVLAFTLPLTQRRCHHKQTSQTVAQ